jgi:hypothetical protein
LYTFWGLGNHKWQLHMSPHLVLQGTASTEG